MKRRSVWAITMVSVMAFVGCAGAGADTPTPTPTSTPSASDEPLATPTPTPKSEEDRAAADAIDTYKAFLHAAHAFANDPTDDDLLEALLSLSVEGSPTESAIRAEAAYYRENGLSGSGFPTVKRASVTKLNLGEGHLTLNACVDNRELEPMEAGSEPPDFTVETVELHRVNNRWKVYLLEAVEGDC